MLAEEGEALAHVARIGLKRLRRQSALAAQMRQPARHLKREIVIGAFDRLNRESRLGHGLLFNALLALYDFCSLYRTWFV